MEVCVSASNWHHWPAYIRNANCFYNGRVQLDFLKHVSDTLSNWIKNAVCHFHIFWWSIRYGNNRRSGLRPRKVFPLLGRFDLEKKFLIFAPGVSIILFCIYKDLGEIPDPKLLKNCLDAKWPVLLYKILIFGKFCHFYYIKWPSLGPESFRFLDLILLPGLFRCKTRCLNSGSKNLKIFFKIESPYPLLGLGQPGHGKNLTQVPSLCLTAYTVWLSLTVSFDPPMIYSKSDSRLSMSSWRLKLEWKVNILKVPFYPLSSWHPSVYRTTLNDPACLTYYVPMSQLTYNLTLWSFSWSDSVA